MLGRLNHIAIAVPDLLAAAEAWRKLLGAEISAVQPLPEHGVQVIFISLPNAKIELLGVLGENSPIARFLEKNPLGGIHHFCIETEKVVSAAERLKALGARLTGSDTPKIGAHGVPVIFLHPQNGLGALVELEEAAQ